MLLQDDIDNLGQAERADIIAQLPSLDGMEVLELAAGIGRYTTHLAHVASHVTAVDFIERFLEQNRKATVQFNNVSYCCVDVMDVAFEPESFDFVFINWLFMYLDDQQMLLLRDKIRQWTRIGGYVFFRESCSRGAFGGLYSGDNPTRYRLDSEYTRLFDDGFELIRQGVVKVYEERFNRANQCYWLFQRVIW